MIRYEELPALIEEQRQRLQNLKVEYELGHHSGATIHDYEQCVRNASASLYEASHVEEDVEKNRKGWGITGAYDVPTACYKKTILALRQAQGRLDTLEWYIRVRWS